MSEEAKWYVIHTYSGYENKVASDIEKAVNNRKLNHLIFEVKVPTETVVEIKDNKKKEVNKKIFPGYVLVKMLLNDESWYVVRNTRGCTGFLGPTTKPIPLTNEEVAKLGVETKRVVVEYTVGDSVKIKDGPLKDFVGTVNIVQPEKNYVKLSVLMFGRETPVELEINQVEPIS